MANPIRENLVKAMLGWDITDFGSGDLRIVEQYFLLFETGVSTSLISGHRVLSKNYL